MIRRQVSSLSFLCVREPQADEAFTTSRCKYLQRSKTTKIQRRRADSLDTSVHARTPLLCGCLLRVVKPILEYKRFCRNGVAVLLFTLDTVLQHLRVRSLLVCCLRRAVKPILIYKRSCRNGVAVVLLTLDMVFLHERQREPQARKKLSERLVGAWPGPSGEQAGGCQGCGAVLRPQQACREGSENTAGGGEASREKKNTARGS